MSKWGVERLQGGNDAKGILWLWDNGHVQNDFRVIQQLEEI